MKKLVIIGASGHGKVVADIAKLNGYNDIVFLDNNNEIKDCLGYPVLGPDNLTKELDGEIFVAVGNSEIRKKIMEREKDRIFPVLVHPSAVVADDVQIGKGTVVMAGAVINSGTIIEDGCIINTASSVDHDNYIKKYCHVSVGAHLCGSVKVGNETWIGAGATISNNIEICSGCIIGAGAVVINNLLESGTYVGVPAKNINKNV